MSSCSWQTKGSKCKLKEDYGGRPKGTKGTVATPPPHDKGVTAVKIDGKRGYVFVPATLLERA